MSDSNGSSNGNGNGNSIPLTRAPPVVIGRMEDLPPHVVAATTDAALTALSRGQHLVEVTCSRNERAIAALDRWVLDMERNFNSLGSGLTTLDGKMKEMKRSSAAREARYVELERKQTSMMAALDGRFLERERKDSSVRAAGGLALQGFVLLVLAWAMSRFAK